MKISMDIIYTELKDLIVYSSIICSSPVNIETVRFLDGENESCNNYVYVSDHLPKSEIEPFHFVYCGNVDDVSHIKDSDVLVIAPGTSIFTVMNRLTDVFKKYNNWERDIYHLLCENKSPQDLLNISHPIFNAGLTLLDWNHNVIAFTDDEMEGCPLWDAIKSGYGYKYKFIIENSEPKISFLNKKKCISQNWNNIDNRYLLNIPLMINNLPQYGIGIHKTIDPQKPFEKSYEQLAVYLSYYMTLCLEKQSRKIASYNTLYDAFINNLFKGDIADPDEINRLNAYIPIEKNEPLCSIVIQFKGINYRSSLLEYRASELEQMWDSSRCSILTDKILWLIGLGELKDLYQMENKFKRQFDQWLEDHNAYCGVSVTFSSLKHLKTHYEEALSTLEYGLVHPMEDNQRIFNYYDHLDIHILDIASRTSNVERFVHPALMLLKDFDADHGTDYYETLKQYVLYCGYYKINEIAEKMHIHRNTLNYRIEKIMDITQCDITSPEKQRTLRFSILCCDTYPEFKKTIHSDN